MRVLIIEDEARIASNVKEILESANFVVDVSTTGEEGLYQAQIQDYDAIVMDWMLPDIEGVEICSRLRAEGNKSTILMMTARNALEDKLQCFNGGCDDYLTKPFAMEELIVRVKALVRRKNTAPISQIITIGNLQIDTNLCKVKRGGKTIELAPKEFSLLDYLAQNLGRAIDRQELLEHVWGEEIDPLSNTIDVHIRYLRNKIDEPFKQKLIKTIKGKGYVLCRD